MQKLGSDPTLRDEIRKYLLGKYQADSPTWQERFGQVESLSAFLQRVQETYPQEIEAICHLVLPRVDTSDEAYRQSLKMEQMRRDGVVFFTELPVGLPETGGSFDTFVGRGNSSVERAVEAVRQWLAEAGPPILTLVGRPGTGKTHLSTAAGRYLLGKNKDVLFRREGDLMADFRRAVPQHQVEEILATFSTVPWLILDDLGTASLNDSGMLGELRDRLFDARWQNTGLWRGAMRTLVTTNLLSDQLPPRVASRLSDTRWGNPVVGIDAADYRVHGA